MPRLWNQTKMRDKQLDNGDVSECASAGWSGGWLRDSRGSNTWPSWNGCANASLVDSIVECFAVTDLLIQGHVSHPLFHPSPFPPSLRSTPSPLVRPRVGRCQSCSPSILVSTERLFSLPRAQVSLWPLHSSCYDERPRL